MEPGLDRAMMLPFAGSREEGNLQFAAPGFVYDAARAFVTPGMAAKGQRVSDEDILNTAMNVMGGGVGASRVAGPRTASDEVLLGMGVRSSGADDYRGSHQSPDRDFGASLDNLTALIPEDVYGPAGPRLYGIGDPEIDREVFNSLRAVRGKPDAEVTVYRAVPENVSTINEGDWVTTSRKYADLHGERTLDDNYNIIEQKAKAGDLLSEGYPYEFGYRPSVKSSESALDMSTEARMQRAQELGFDTSRPLYHSTNASFDVFEVPEGKFLKFGKGVYTAPSAKYSDRYIRKNRDMESGYNEGANVMPLYARGKIASEKDWEAARQEMMSKGVAPSGYDPLQEEIQKRLKEKGFDGLNMFGNEIIIFDPKNLRSVNAAFDPAKSDSSNITFAQGGAVSSAKIMLDRLTSASANKIH
jgi:hypothetical protein